MAKLPIVPTEEIPRDGYLYSLYRGHMTRLAIVIAILAAIILWAWGNSLTVIRSYLFPSGTADLAAIAQQTMQTEEGKDSGRSALEEKRIESSELWVQNRCYRLLSTIDRAEALPLFYGDTRLWRVYAGEDAFLAASDAEPKTGTAVKAVFWKANPQLIYDYAQSGETRPVSAYVMDLRQIPANYESSDTIEMLVVSLVVVALFLFWLLMAIQPGRHPMYRQLTRFGLRPLAIITAIDQEVASGQVTETNKLTQTANWRLQRSAFTTTIYKMTATAEPEAEQGDTKHE